MLISHLLGLPATVDADPSAIIIAADLGGRISISLPWNLHASMAPIFPKWVLLGFCFFILPTSELKSQVVESELQSLGHIPVPWVQIEVEKLAFWLLLELEVCRMHERGIFLKIIEKVLYYRKHHTFLPQVLASPPSLHTSWLPMF